MIEQLIYIGCGIISLSFVYYIDGISIAKEVIAPKYKRWCNLNKLVSSTESSAWRIIWISMKLIIFSLYISFLQKINKTVKQIDRKTYEISYVINGTLYKLISQVRFGPIPILQIIDDEENDITENVLPYMGPAYNWHGSKISPDFFGHKTLTFELSDGTEYTYAYNASNEDVNRDFNKELSDLAAIQKELQNSISEIKMNL